MSDKVNLYIDGVEIQADPGSMIIQAAMITGCTFHICVTTQV